jgi:hypothetical protein
MAGGRSLRCGPFAPLPQKTCGPEPGGSCLAKLGPVPRGGQYALVDGDVDNLGKRWSVPVDSGERACEVRDGGASPASSSCDIAVHGLWTADCKPARAPFLRGGRSGARRPIALRRRASFAAWLLAARFVAARFVAVGLLAVRFLALRFLGAA